MKKLLFCIALVGMPLGGLTGCGRSGETKVIDGGDSAPVMSDSDMSSYEEQMRSGAISSGPGSGPPAGSSSPPGN